MQKKFSPLSIASLLVLGHGVVPIEAEEPVSTLDCEAVPMDAEESLNYSSLGSGTQIRKHVLRKNNKKTAQSDRDDESEMPTYRRRKKNQQQPNPEEEQQRKYYGNDPNSRNNNGGRKPSEGKCGEGSCG